MAPGTTDGPDSKAYLHLYPEACKGVADRHEKLSVGSVPLMNSSKLEEQCVVMGVGCLVGGRWLLNVLGYNMKHHYLKR